MATVPSSVTPGADGVDSLTVVPVGAMPERALRDLLSELPKTARRIWPAWAMLAVCVALSIVMLALLSLVAVREGFSTDIAQFLVWGPLFIANVVAGLLILHRYPGHRVGWVLCLAGFTWVTANAFWCYGAIGLDHEAVSLPAADIMVQFGSYYPFGLYFILVELLLIFPRGQLASPRWRVVRVIGLIGALGASLSIATGPYVMNAEFGDIPNPWHVTGAAGTILEIAGVGFLLIFAMGILAGVSMVRRLRRATGVERVQLRWIAWDAVVLLLAFVIHFLAINATGGQGWYWGVGLAWGVVLNSFAVVTGLAILRYRLYDIDIVIHRSVLYTAMIAVIAVLYVALVGLIDTVAQRLDTDRPSPWVASIVVATGVALAAHPLRRWLEGVVNRRIYGERDHPGEVLARLGARLEAAVAPADLLGEVTRTVTDLLRVPHAAVALRIGERLEVVAESGTPGAEQVGVPMVYRHEPIGELRVTPRGPGEGFSRADSVVLDGVAGQTAVAAYAMRVTADLQQARERLVTAREEERRRLRRDLHDGLGAELAALTMQANGVRRLLHSDPASAETELGAMQAELRAAIGDIRRLVHGLRPPALDEFGLVAAMRSRLVAWESGTAGISATLDASGDDSVLPAATEVAVYRIVEEALTNIGRHAGARQVHVSLELDGEVRLAIADDGRGIPPQYAPGVGIHSMRERTEELGGQFEIGPGETTGTRIDVTIPLPEDA